MSTFYELKSQKWKQPLNISKTVFYEHVLEFHRPSKFLCQTSGRQNHWSPSRILALSPVLEILHFIFSQISFLSVFKKERMVYNGATTKEECQ